MQIFLMLQWNDKAKYKTRSHDMQTLHQRFNDKILWQTVRDGRLYVFIYLKMGGSRHSRAQTT